MAQHDLGRAPFLTARVPVEPPRPVPRGLWFDVLIVLAFAGLTAALVWWPPILHLDLAVRDWCDRHQPAGAHAVGLMLDHLGQGSALIAATLVSSVWLVRRHRNVGILTPALLAFVLSDLLNGWLKWWTERNAPHYGSVYMFDGGGGMEYPSGHVSNGVVYYGVLAMLLAPYITPAARRVLRWLPGPLVIVGTTYIGYHWFTDSIGGYLVGTFILRLILRLPPRLRPPARGGRSGRRIRPDRLGIARPVSRDARHPPP